MPGEASFRVPVRARALCSLVLVGSLALAGCNDADSGASGEGPDGQTVARGLTVAGTWPLTGLPAKGSAPKHPVMVVKIDNTSSSAPQVGLSKADLVTEELVEGGSTRLAVFFYQRIPRLVGPVRSMRATDIGIVRPAKAVLVASGGAPPTVHRVKAAGIKAYTEGATGYQRDTGRRAPYNLFMRLGALAKRTAAKDTVDSYLPFGAEKALPKGQPATGIAAQFSGGHTTHWRYQRGKYVDPNSFAAAGDRFRPDTVLVLRVRVGDAGYLDPAGNRVPETKFTGSGQAQVFHGGRVVRGTWHKTLDSSISLRTASGKLVVPAGHTWVELVPAQGGKVTVTK
jgi:predicted small secreted protein